MISLYSIFVAYKLIKDDLETLKRLIIDYKTRDFPNGHERYDLSFELLKPVEFIYKFDLLDYINQKHENICVPKLQQRLYRLSDSACSLSIQSNTQIHEYRIPPGGDLYTTLFIKGTNIKKIEITTSNKNVLVYHRYYDDDLIIEDLFFKLLHRRNLYWNNMLKVYASSVDHVYMEHAFLKYDEFDILTNYHSKSLGLYIY